VRKEKLAVSSYKAFQGEIWNCPPEETPMPEVTPEFWEESPILENP